MSSAEELPVDPLAHARFCVLCAAELESTVPEGDDRPRRRCPACGTVLYHNPRIAAGTVPVHEGRVALIRRGVQPGRGKWSWPCGYVEIDETVKECAVRETREESGLEVTLGPLLGMYSYPLGHDGGAPDTGMVIVAFAATVDATELCAGDDADAAQWFAPDEIPWEEIAFDSSLRGLRDAGFGRPTRP